MIACILAGIVALTSALSAVASLFIINDTVPEALWVTGDLHAFVLILQLDFYLLVLSYFAVAMWIYRAHANFDLIEGPAKEYTPGWAIGWFFVPIANLFVPFKAMKELWQGSHGQPLDDEATAPSLLWIWWLCWLAGSILSIGTEINTFDVFAFAASSISAMCLIEIIRLINRAQPDMRISRTFE